MEEQIKKTEPKEEVKEVKKHKSGKTTFLAVGIGVGVIILLSVGTFLGVWGIPKVTSLYNRLTGKETNTATDDTKVKVTSEENVVIDVVSKSKDAVVSIALSKDTIGTGFIVDKSGIIITNQHVVSVPNQKYQVITSDGKSHDVTEAIIDDTFDIAILKISGDNFSALTLGDSDLLKVGQLVIAIGNPLGEYAGSVTTGVISGLGRSVTTQSGSFWSSTAKQYDNVIQTDAAINPGNSGGPLLSSSNNVIGVNFATTSGAENISFALPINLVKQRLDEYRKYGKFIKPYMGIEYNMDPLYQYPYYSTTPGGLIVRVVAGGPADKAGIKVGDLITKIADVTVNQPLVTMIQKHKVGEEIKVELIRNGKTLTLTVKLEEAK
ncbi:trypsin-like peptidase domain-containing protein [Candidatus Dojkabacteria bacterium]|jgi:serine protease Do|nr:trypsin-like peptidase domain-containing protein [Candidatus Dojkabacteria bacterium]